MKKHNQDSYPYRCRNRGEEISNSEIWQDGLIIFMTVLAILAYLFNENI